MFACFEAFLSKVAVANQRLLEAGLPRVSLADMGLEDEEEGEEDWEEEEGVGGDFDGEQDAEKEGVPTLQ